LDSPIVHPCYFHLHAWSVEYVAGISVCNEACEVSCVCQAMAERLEPVGPAIKIDDLHAEPLREAVPANDARERREELEFVEYPPFLLADHFDPHGPLVVRHRVLNDLARGNGE
jgi:hypothetical protein